MARYLIRPAEDFDLDPEDFTNAVIVSGADPVEVASANDEEVVVQAIALSPERRVTPSDNVPWLPTDLASGTLVLWLDASDAGTLWADEEGTTPATSGAVARWDDKSGEDNHAVAVGTGPVTGAYTSPNSKNVLHFNSSAQMDLPALGIVGAGARMMLAVVGPKRAVGDRVLFGTGAPVGGATAGRWSIGASGGTMRVEYQGGNTSSDVDADTPGVIGVTHDGHTNARGVFIRNGVETSYNDTGDSPNTVDANAIVGARAPGSGGSFAGDLMALYVVVGAVSEADRKRLVGYAAHKWGFADQLPPEHDYYDTPPMVGG